MRAAFTLLALGGCAFDSGGLPGGPDARAADAGVDAAPTIDAVADLDLVAAYRFESDVALTQPYDDTGYANHGTSSGVGYVAGPPGHGLAMQFSPQSVVVVPDSASLDVAAAMTLEAWVYVTVYPPTGARMGLLDNNGQYGLFLLPGGAVRCTVAPGFADRLAVPLNTWTHVACTYDGAQMVLYQDGVAGTPATMAGPIATGGVDGLGLGQNLPTGEHLSGAMDDARVWRRALTAAEVVQQAP